MQESFNWTIPPCFISIDIFQNWFQIYRCLSEMDQINIPLIAPSNLVVGGGISQRDEANQKTFKSGHMT